MLFDLLLTYYLVKGTALVAAVALLFGLRPRPLLVGLVALAAILWFLTILWQVVSHFGQLEPHFGIDFQLCWEAGRDFRTRVAPTVLHPPSVLPLFVVFSLVPLRVSYYIWTALNAVACLGLVALAQTVLLAQEKMADASARPGRAAWGLSPQMITVLTAALLLSDATLATFALGQLSILETLALLAALFLQSRGRSVWAGAGLALATLKPGTLLPFLLLFLRKADHWAWRSFVTITLVLCVVTACIIDLPAHLAATRDRIQRLETPGEVNDYSFQGPFSQNMLGFDHALYRLGLRDRKVIRVAQYLALLVLGAWVARQVLGKDALPRAAACSLVTLYSILFLYHRVYDTILLVIPLAYCAGRAASASSRVRYLYACCAVAILLVLNLDSSILKTVQDRSLDWGVGGRLVQATLLPYATWFILLAMVGLVRASRHGAGRTAQRCGA